jgi:alpha-L-fucosidase
MYERSVGHGAVLLLNNTPDTTGRIPEADVHRAAEFGEAIRRSYGTAAGETAGRGTEVMLTLSEPTLIDRIVTMEDIAAGGERVVRYVIEGRGGGALGDEWKELTAGTAIGHKKIDRVTPTQVLQMRLRLVEAVGEPLIRRLAVYRMPGRGE